MHRILSLSICPSDAIRPGAKTLSEIQYYGTGRRKTSAARVFLRPGDGSGTVNGRDFEEYFNSDVLKMLIRAPLHLTETIDKFDLYITVKGGGMPFFPKPTTTGCSMLASRKAMTRGFRMAPPACRTQPTRIVAMIPRRTVRARLVLGMLPG